MDFLSTGINQSIKEVGKHLMKVKKDIINLIEELPQVKFEFENEEVLVINSIKSNYSIRIAFSEREHTVFFVGWHWHFTNEEENQYMIETILDIIQNRTRLKEKIVNGKRKGSTLEFQNENGEWESSLKTGMISFNFWGGKKETKYEYKKIEF